MHAIRFGLVAATLLLAVLPAAAQRVLARGEQALLTAEALEKLKLTAEQKEKYAKIETEFKDRTKAAQDKFAEDIKGINDRAKYRELNEKLQADRKKVRDDHLARVEPILTAEQKTVFAQVKNQQVRPGIGVRPAQPAVGGIGPVLPPAVQQRLNLTDEQKKQIADLQKDIEAKVLKVLTDEQRKQFEEMKKGAVRRPAPANQPNESIRRRPSVDGAPPIRNRD